MADAFSQFDASSLLVGKHVLFIGDSNTRAHYKDLLWLLSSNTLMSNSSLRAKSELSFLGEKLLKRSELNQARDFKEHRIINFETGTVLEFVFITRCYNHQVEDLFKRIGNKTKSCPDIIVMNSCVWDLTRWGPKGVPQYKDNMVRLLRLMKQSLPLQCLVIWTTALPPAAHVRGGLIIKQVECMEPLLRFEVMEANTFARDVVANHGFDVLDLHYYSRMQMHRRSKDGIHYMPIAVRLMTNLLLTHIALTWDSELPNNINSVLLDKAITQASNAAVKSVVTIPNNGIFSKINLKSPVVPRHRGLKITFNVGEGKTLRNCHLKLGNETENNPREMNKPLPPLSPRGLMISVEAEHNCRRALAFQDQPEYGPYRQRNKNKKYKNKGRNKPYYDKRYMY